IRKVVDDFYTAAAADKKVNFWRDEKFVPKPGEVTAVKEGLTMWLAEKAGGPEKYTGKSMKDAHKGMKITDAQFSAAAQHLEKAVEKNKVKPEAARAVMIFAEATRADLVEPGPTDSSVKGRVTFKGLNVAAGSVTVHEGENRRIGQIKDGLYEVNGLKPGKYAVTVESKIADKSLLPEKYSDPKTTPLLVDAKPGVVTLDLTLEDGKEEEELISASRPGEERQGDTADVIGKATFQGKPIAKATVGFVADGKAKTAVVD